MENIIKLFGAAGVLALICVGIVVLLYPIMFEIKFKETCICRGVRIYDNHLYNSYDKKLQKGEEM